MRTSLQVFLIATVMVSNTAAAQTDGRQGAARSTADALIAHLPLDGSIVDKVSGVTPTVLVGTGPTEGKFDGALQFDGSSFVQLPIDISPQALPELTITMWVKPDRLPDDPELRKAVYPNAYLLSDGNGLLTIGNQQKDIPYYSAYSLGAVINNSNHPGMRGGWQLLAITRKIEDRTTDDGDVWPHTVLTLYSNGRVTEKAGIRKEKAITPYLNLGANSKGSSGKFRGAIDDVRVYSKAMSHEEIRASASQQNPTRVEGIRTAASGQSGENDSSGRVAGTPTYDQVGREQTFPGDMFDGGEQQFPGDMFEGDEQQFPGDMFEGDEEQFPGDMFDGEVTAQSSVGAPGSAQDPLLGGSATGVDPRAGVGAIGTSNPTFTPPVSTADETEELIASEEGQELLQSADWRIEGMVPNSADKTDLYPGDEVTVKIRISKDDPANKIPNVRLVTNVGPGAPSPTYELTMNTAEAKPTDEREIPVTLPVPANLEFAEGASQVHWRPRVWLNAFDGRPLRDAIADNHSRELVFTVQAEPVDNSCTEVHENEDGTRVTRPCLQQAGRSDSIYIDHAVLVSTDFQHMESHADGARALMIFDETLDPLTKIEILENWDRPCEIEVGGPNSHRRSDNCGQRYGVGESKPDRLRFSAPRNEVITGLSICRNDSGNRLKGFQFETRRVLPDGDLSTSSTVHTKKEHPNCDDEWLSLRQCQPGAAAAGLEVHWGVGAKDFIHSINLMCGEVKVREEQP